MVNAILIFVALFCGALFISPVAQAQSNGTGSDSTFKILSKAVIVSSTRADDESPVAHTTVDSVTIANWMVGQDVQYVLERSVPSVLAYSESGTGLSNYGTFRLRGIDQTRVNVTLNGAPLNDMIDQGVFFSNITDLLNGMHSIQVQRGVGVTSNGTASFAGSVSIESPLPVSQHPSARLQLTTGSFGLLRGSAEVSSGSMNGLAVSAKASAFTTDGYRYNTGTNGFSGVVQASYQVPNNMLRFTAIGGQTANQLGYIPVSEPLANIDPRTNVNDSTDHDRFGQYLVQAEWTRTLSEQTALTAMVYAGGAGGDYFSGFRDSIGTLTQINYPLQNRHYGVLTSLYTAGLGKGLEVTTSVHAYLFHRKNWETLSPENESPYYQDETRKRELSGTVRMRWLVAGNMHTSYPALRFDADLQLRSVAMEFLATQTSLPVVPTIPTHNWFFANPRVGALYALNPHNHVYASAGLCSREPTRWDMLGGTQITEANVDVLLQQDVVKSEQVTDFELGFRTDLFLFSASRPDVQIDFGTFLMLFTNEIAPVGEFIPQYFVQRRINVDRSSRYGAELSLSWTIASQLTLRSHVTMMRSNIRSVYLANLDTTVYDVEGVLTPNILGTGELCWNAAPWFEVSAGLQHIGSQFLELTNQDLLTLPSATIAHIGMKFVHGPWQATARMNNVFNTPYAVNGSVDYSSGSATSAVFMQATRNVWVLLQYSM